MELVDYISDDNTLYAEERSADDAGAALAIKQDADALLQATSFDDSQFERLYQRVLALYDPAGDDTDHSIGNLLNPARQKNRRYKNAVFPIKRATIIALDQSYICSLMYQKCVFKILQQASG